MRRWIDLSLIEHYAYCPRQAVLIDREEWTDNRHTAGGQAAHARVDTDAVDHRRAVTVHHSVPLRHDRLRLHGIADSVEERTDGSLTPVEHKAGASTGGTRAAALQVVAQAQCLTGMTGTPVTEAVLYFRRDNRRVAIPVQETIPELLEVLGALRRDLSSHALPAWTPKRSRCRHCSLAPSCLPQLSEHLDQQ